MAISDQVQAPEGPAVAAWYALSAEEVTTRLGVDPATGLGAARAAEHHPRQPSQLGGPAAARGRP